MSSTDNAMTAGGSSSGRAAVGSRRSSFLNVVGANVRKVVIEMLRYLPNTLSLLVTFYAVFLFVMLGVNFLGDPTTAADNTRYAIVANTFWLLLLLGVNSMGWEITTEATRGTLEQLYMSPTPAWLILLARMIGTLIVNLLLMVVLLFASMLTAQQWLNLDVAALLLIMPPTLLGVIGLGFVMAGLAIVYKQIDSILQVVQFVYLAMVYVPLTALPLLELAPSVKGIDMLRQVLSFGLPIGSFALRDWASLLASGVLYFVFGVLVFKLCERRAIDRGLLGQY